MIATRAIIGFASSVCLCSAVVVASDSQYILGDDENSPQQSLVVAGKAKALASLNRNQNAAPAESQTLLKRGDGLLGWKEKDCLDYIDEKTSAIVSLMTDPAVSDEEMVSMFQQKLEDFIDLWSQFSQASAKVKNVYKHKLSYCMGNCIDLSQLSDTIKEHQGEIAAIFGG